MSPSTFFRLLTSPIPAKGDDLRQQIEAINQGQPADEVFISNPADFSAIPGSPYAYWVGDNIRSLFISQLSIKQNGFSVQIGASSHSDFRFLRLFWEVPQFSIGQNKMWSLFAKGGRFSPFYSDIYLLINWEDGAQEIKDYLNLQYPYLKGETGWILHPESTYYRPGLTWPRRTNGFSVRTLPAGCIFADKGPAIFVPGDISTDLASLMAVMNSSSFHRLVSVQLARTELAQSYEIGLIQQTPIPARLSEAKEELATWTLQAYVLSRQSSLGDETAHVFCLPALLSLSRATLAESLQALAKVENQRQNAMASLQAQIDTRVAELYGVPELAEFDNRQLILDESQEFTGEPAATEDGDDEEGEAETASMMRPSAVVSDFLMWCVGVAFGRWDVRYAIDPSKLPSLPGPFDTLPVCSPGMLVGTDGYPATTAPVPYPLFPAFDGFLVDDPDHPRDIVSAVEHTLALLWPGRSDEIEKEACQILGAPDLRAWFRDPRGFFAYHTKRYSKSRRKAPIYWPLQSAKRSYTIWLYYPRLNPGSLYHAAREYADAKLKLEMGRLADYQKSLLTASGSARKLQERKIAGQEALAAELKAFVKALDAAALLELKPDLNDGVLLNIAPLHELVPWKEAGRAWDELLHGKYEWSSIGKQLRQKGLVMNTLKVKEAK